MEPLIQMNKFEVMDLPGMNTIGFVVETHENEGETYYSLEKIEHIANNEEGKIKKTFNVIADDIDDKQSIVLVTLTAKKAVLTTGVLDESGFITTDSNIPIMYGTILNSDGVEYKEVAYNKNLKRNFTIIDTQTAEEVRPNLYIDKVTNEMKGSCKILPNRTYVVLEIS